MQNRLAILLTLAVGSSFTLAHGQVVEPAGPPMIPVGIAPGSYLGWEVKVDGDALVASSPGLNVGQVGEAWVYWKVAGVWQDGGRLQRSNPQPDDWFGINVDHDGNTLAISAARHPLGPRIYVFERVANSWVETAILSVPGATMSFADSLALDGNRIVTDDASAQETYVFERGTSGWTLDQALLGFKGPVAIEGDTLTTTSNGANVVIFERGVGPWTQTANFDFGSATFYLYDPALDQDLLVVPYGLRLHVHERVNGVWQSTAELQSAVRFSARSIDVGISGDLIGAVSVSLINQERDWASLWVREPASPALGAEWSERKLFTLPGVPDNMRLQGDFDGSTLVVGNWGYNPPGPTTPKTGALFTVDVADGSSFFGDSFCHGDTTACPCGFATSYPGGPGCQGSTHGALLVGAGSPSVGADALVMTAFGLPSQTPALLFWGSQTPALLFWGSQTTASALPFGNGLRCVGGQLHRAGVRIATQDGVAAWGQGPSTYGPAGSISSGDELSFQVWYRDLDAFCNQGFNLTNGFQVKLTP